MYEIVYEFYIKLVQKFLPMRIDVWHMY